MKRIFFLTLMIFFLLLLPAFADMNISDLEVKAVVSNAYIVSYSWKMDVAFGEDKLRSCKLKILFFDASGSEIYSKSRYISLSPGSNHFTGRGICKPEVWKKIKEYKAHIKCP